MFRDDPLPIYIVNQMVHWFIVGITLPIMILYMTDKGLDLFQAGLVMSIYSGTVIMLELPTGGLSDSIGRKKVYTYSLLVSTFSVITLLFADGLPLFLVGFVLYGVARALSSGSMDAWFVDEFATKHPGGDLQKALATANVFIPMGIGAGCLLGGALPMLASGFTSGIEWMSAYSVNIIVVIFALIVQLALTAVLVQERSFKGPGTGMVSGVQAMPKVISDAITFGIKDRFTLVMMLSSAFLGFGLLSVELLWQPRALGLMEDPTQTWIFGVLAAGYFFASSAGNLFATRISRSFGHDDLKMLIWVRALSGLILMVLSWMTGMLEFAVLYLLLYLVFGVANSPHAAVFNTHIPKERRSTLMSFESLMLQGGGLVGSLTMGWLAQAFGIASAWTVAGAILLLSSITYGYLWSKGRGRKA